MKGFTLTELLATIVIASVLAAIAVPSFSYWLTDSKQVTTVNSFQAHLALARSEAVKRNGVVRLAPITTWSEGYRVEVMDEDGEPELLLKEKVHGEPLGIASTGLFVDELNYNAHGLPCLWNDDRDGCEVIVNLDLDLDEQPIFTFCDERGEIDGRQVEVGLLGRGELYRADSRKPNEAPPLISCLNPVRYCHAEASAGLIPAC